MPAPWKRPDSYRPVDVEDSKAEELDSSSCHDALEINDATELHGHSRQKRSRSRDKGNGSKEGKQRSGHDGNSKSASQSKGLPPGWVRVKSKTKPGAYYYAHPATNRTQSELPMDIYAGLAPVATNSEQTVHSSTSKVLGPSNPTPADKLKAVTAEASKKREQAEQQRKIDQEKALWKKQIFDSRLQKVEAEERAEEAAREEELLKVRAKRKAELAKAAELEDAEKHDKSRDHEEVPRAIGTRPEKAKGKARSAGIWLGQSAPAPPALDEDPDPPPALQPKLTKKQIKEEKKRKAKDKILSKEAKKLEKKRKKERKAKKAIKKLEKKVRLSLIHI